MNNQLETWVILLTFTLATIPASSQDSSVASILNDDHEGILVIVDSVLVFEDYYQAKTTCLTALSQLDPSQNPSTYVHLLTHLTEAVLMLGDATTAQLHLDQALQLAAQYHTAGVEAGELERIRAKWHAENGHDSLAQIHFLKGVAILEECCKADGSALGKTYLEYSKYLDSRDDPLARIYFNKTVEILQNSTSIYSSIRLADAYIRLGDLVRASGETQLHGHFLNGAKLQLDRHRRHPYGILKNFYYSLGQHYTDEKKWPEVILVYDTIGQLIIERDGEHAWELYYPLATKGSAQVRMQEPEAWQTLKQAEKIYFRSSFQVPSVLGFIHHRMGLHFQNQNHSDSTVLYFTLAARNYRLSQDSVFLAELHRDIAEFYLVRKISAEALKHIDSALVYAGFDYLEAFHPKVLQTENVDIYFDPLELRARILLSLYEETNQMSHLHASLDIYHKIEQIAEFTQNGSYTNDTKRIVSEHFHRAAQGALKTLTLLNQLSPDPAHVISAFGFMEHNRYAQLFQEMEQSRQLSSPQRPDHLAEQHALFKTEIERLTHKQENSQLSRKEADSLLRLQMSWQQLREELRRKYPGQFQIQYDSMFTLPQIQEKIPPTQQLFEYFWGEATITLIASTRDTAILASINKADVEKELLQIFPNLAAIYVVDSLALSFEQFIDCAHRLYQLLLAPFIQQGTKRLIISTDGMLSFLPFSVLCTSGTTTSGDFQNAPYLLRSHEVQYTFSSNILFKQLPPPRMKNPRVLAMAYSDEDDDPLLISREGYHEIPHTAREIRMIEREMKGRVTGLKGDRATKESFLKLAPEHDVLHLAVHGTADTASALNSHLIFKSAISKSAGRLYAHELYNLSASHWRLAVLSACETGVGKYFEGEGVFSMARGFASAGMPTIVMSLWRADDQSTEQIMESFYKDLAQGKDVTTSLHQAKLQFLDSENNEGRFNPFYWAGFVSLGNGSAIVKPPFISPFLVGLISVLLVLILAIFLVKTRYRSTRTDLHGLVIPPE